MLLSLAQCVYVNMTLVQVTKLIYSVESTPNYELCNINCVLNGTVTPTISIPVLINVSSTKFLTGWTNVKIIFIPIYLRLSRYYRYKSIHFISICVLVDSFLVCPSMNILNNNIQLLCLMHVMAANIWACKLIHSEQHSNQAVK